MLVKKYFWSVCHIAHIGNGMNRKTLSYEIPQFNYPCEQKLSSYFPSEEEAVSGLEKWLEDGGSKFVNYVLQTVYVSDFE